MAMPIFQMVVIPPQSNDEDVKKKSGRERESTDQNVDKSERGT
jgi:hypothetical protein